MTTSVRVMTWRRSMLLVLPLLFASVVPGRAQTEEAPSEPARSWAAEVGAGLSLTSGNSDTLNFNLSFDLHRDPEARNVWSATGLFLRGEQDGEPNANRSALKFRDQVNLDGMFVFGQIEYLRDTFKSIDYLVAPTVGLGYTLVQSDPLQLLVDAGVGGVWEKNPGLERDASGSVTTGQQLTYSLSDTATIKQAVSALWKMKDFSDGLYVFSAALATDITAHAQLSVELLDTFKNRPPDETTKKNDVALVMAFTVKY